MYTIEKSIVKALAYFNVFSYPLKKEEIFNFLDVACNKTDFEKTLVYLCRREIIYRYEEFYSLQQNDGIAERRTKGNNLALGQLKIARKISKFLYKFPFVKGIAVSGSLSKNYADEKSDLDFFIITKANRLWLARTLMHGFKKLTFLSGRQHWFCMNYYIDELALEIKEKNIFTAVEVATVLPLCGDNVFKAFINENKWVKDYFPVHLRWNDAASENKEHLIKPVRKIDRNSTADKLNEFFMRITAKRWKQKADKRLRSYSGELMGMDADIHYAKPDPENLQRKILYRYEKEVDAALMGLESLKAV